MTVETDHPPVVVVVVLSFLFLPQPHAVAVRQSDMTGMGT